MSALAIAPHCHRSAAVKTIQGWPHGCASLPPFTRLPVYPFTRLPVYPRPSGCRVLGLLRIPVYPQRWADSISYPQSASSWVRWVPMAVAARHAMPGTLTRAAAGAN